jgi:predicted phosphohydrolase
MHYPPQNDKKEGSGFTELFERYGADEVVFGHLHGHSAARAPVGESGGVRYTLASCDTLGFKLVCID